ncbi:MAG: DUF134 domain-containing protein [Flavobacteriaceae bacterium]|jgi:predicted DNA-binding protein (UPF0251 family)/predicted Fe-Mo cluster-binding NifX family protein|nr:DUF134 domain-containing protein [Flavobacteriaceae bacterium]
MSRPKKTRNIAFIPTVLGFKPYGHSDPEKKGEPVFLFNEEYEAMRLCDYEKHTQQQAAELMGVSRPTLTRIYMSAREKIAQGFIEGRQIIVEGGKVHLDKDWYACNSCESHFTYPYKNKALLHKCPLCGHSLSKNPKEKRNKPEVPVTAEDTTSAKVSITSMGNTLDSYLDKHFGRCSYFAILDTETLKINFVKNPYKNLDERTGFLAAELMENYQVKKIISGDFGLKVKPLLTKAEIQMIIIKEKAIKIKDIVQLITHNIINP